jgi:predicted MFS family arabinose efflux permease
VRREDIVVLQASPASVRVDSDSPYSKAYLAWALALLVAVYTSNFIDRTILAVLQQPIKEELKLSDAQLGLLGGFAFAAFYATLGVPIARLAERRSRRGIITISLVIWSAMTALCGGATSYPALFALRVGVGVGEAGASPPAHSLIADYFPRHLRATALSIYSLGIPLGILFGALLGGVIAQRYGWRPAFVIVGVPGLVLAALTQFTLREPRRGASEAGDLRAVALSEATPSFMAVLRRLGGKPAFLHLAAGASLAAFASYGIGAFSGPFFIRTFHFSLQQTGLVLALINGVAAGVGTLSGGLATDWAAKHDPRWYMWIPALGQLIAAPLYALGYLTPSWPIAVAILILPPIFQYLYLGPSFGVMHNMVSPRMRATSTALLFLAINLVGLGFGPTLVGVASDLYAAHHFASAVHGAFAHLCPGGRAGPNASAGLGAACKGASAFGVRWAIVTCTLVYLWSALHYALAAKTVAKDMAA